MAWSFPLALFEDLIGAFSGLVYQYLTDEVPEEEQGYIYRVGKFLSYILEHTANVRPELKEQFVHAFEQITPNRPDASAEDFDDVPF